MTDTKQTGRMGEDAAAKYLCEKGYTILLRNLRVEHDEIDILALHGGALVFVEVKTRHAVQGLRSPYGTPADAVDGAKKAHLLRAAEAYWKGNNQYRSYAPRIDVVEVYLDRRDCVYRIEHYENAVRKRDIRKR